MSNDIHQFSVRALLTEDVDYVIPMYQRNYAWDEGEITQMIRDVLDYLPGGENYYIGTLVVAERHKTKGMFYEAIDGQQRLTTLSLLACYFNNEAPEIVPWYKRLSIHFENREKSRKTFEKIFEGNFANDPSEVLSASEINGAILNGYRLIKKLLPQNLKEYSQEEQAFAEYLFNKVQVMRVKVPRDTDLNHYFEIMNSRGEQLERHEVLKSRMLETLNRIRDPKDREESKNCFHMVWEACANMERYVQLGFSTAQRDVIFGDKNWSSLSVKSFEELRAVLGVARNEGISTRALNEIISGLDDAVDVDEISDDLPERFNTIINFPNFLLHVLRVVSKENIPLDDKALLSTFEKYIINSDKSVDRAKKFTFGLLKCKYLLDQYVIKREFVGRGDGWSLKRFKWVDGGRRNKSGRGSYVNAFGADDDDEGYNCKITMLLSAFHVSTPTMAYKHWLNAALHYLYRENSIQAEKYLAYLESVAKAFVFDRFLNSKEKVEYFSIIYGNDGKCQAKKKSISKDCFDRLLSFGQIENNFVFNYLDYLLWLANEKDKCRDSRITDYEFTFRSSVEHFYPRNPMPGLARLPSEKLDSFGNLCLISHSKNSRLSNFTPEAKKDYYMQSNIDSIKQYLMMKFKPWDATSIHQHGESMKEVLLKSLEDD